MASWYFGVIVSVVYAGNAPPGVSPRLGGRCGIAAQNVPRIDNILTGRGSKDAIMPS
ncbi:MAG: hypothetical protein NVSMB68_05660 [Thermoanaerobaculia bacterium]